MTRPRPADLALVHLLRRSLPTWTRSAGFEAMADKFDAIPAPTNDALLCIWAEEIHPLGPEWFDLGFSLSIIADSPDGRRVAEAARKIPDQTGDRELVEIVAEAFGIGSPAWWAAVVAVDTIEKLVVRVGIISLAQAINERRPDPVAEAVRILDALARFRTEAAPRIPARAKSSRSNSAPRQP